MKVNIERAIKSITDDIDFYQPLYEGIVNAFQADANELIINFIFEKDYVVGYSIQDNGEGFTDENINAFLTLWSDHKIKKGALGSGRILCLKVFDDIIIDSQTADSAKIGQEVHIEFNRRFEANNINDKEIVHQEKSSSKSFTKTIYKNINDEYLSFYNKNKRPFSAEDVQNDIFINLLPLFISRKTSMQPFSIYFAKELWINEVTLEAKFADLNFEEKFFTLTTKYQEEEDHVEENFKFTLTYQIKDDKQGKLEQFYGAADRKVRPFTGSVQIKPLPNKHSGIFCLSSPYLDVRVKDSRKDFVIEANQNIATNKNPILLPDINNELEKLLIDILFNKFPTIEKDLNIRKQKIASQFPHLVKYIDPIKKLGATEAEILKDAEKSFSDNTKKTIKSVVNFTNAIKKGKNFDEEKFLSITAHFTETGREQLASYIGYRQTIIDMLIEISIQSKTKKDSAKEKAIHDLFMPMSETSLTSHSHANNIWIFDDKFMSFNYAASDKTIAKIVADVEGKLVDIFPHHKEKEPDLVMFYSDKEDTYKDVVLIEFKRLHETIDAKEKAINQLERYPLYIRKNIENVRSIFAYTIIDIDDELREVLEDVKGFHINAFGDKDNHFSSYYNYNEKQNAHINVVSFDQVLHDASKRNKVFLDILLEQLKS